MKDIIRKIIKETFENIPLPDQEEVLKQVESNLEILSQYEALRRLTVSEITLKVLRAEFGVDGVGDKLSVSLQQLRELKEEVKEYVRSKELDDGEELCLVSQELIVGWIEIFFEDKIYDAENMKAPSTEDMEHIMREADEKLQKPPCLECGAMTAKEAETMCICGGDKDHCHGQELWPDDEEVCTPDEWAEEMGFEIIDPDGWRWKCGELEPRPYSEEISRKEFNVRAIRSTIRPRVQQSNLGAVAYGKDGKMEDFETWWREEIDKCLTPPTPERMAKLAWEAAPKSKADSGLDALLEVVKGIRKSDCGAWLKDCNGIHSCSDGREKRQELMRLLDKLYKAASTITEKTPCLALEIVNHAAMMGCKCQSTGPDVEENRHWQSCIVGKAQAYLGRKVSMQEVP